jgi:hypothetical protein
MDNDSKLLTERYHLVKEGMEFHPTKAREDDPKYHEWVFPDPWTSPYHGISDKDMMAAAYADEELKTHPDYKPDLHLQMSNSNATDVMRSLEPYLHLNARKMKVKINIHHEDYSYSIPIDVFIAGCKSYLEANVARHQPELPTYEVPRQMRKTADVVDFATGVQTPGTEEPVGPRMIHGGREENYIKTRVMKALKIAVTGKEMGAQFMSIG